MGAVELNGQVRHKRETFSSMPLRGTGQAVTPLTGSTSTTKMASGMLTRRMKRELEMLSRGAAPGVTAWPRGSGDRLDRLEGEIAGAPGTPYAGGVFRLDIQIPPEYPLKPPSIRFMTKIYHPNIDTEGRICLDTLNMPPKGAWKPSLNISTVLTTIQALMSTPNPDDGLMPDISDQFQRNRTLFDRTAALWTKEHASGSSSSTAGASSSAENSKSAPGPSRPEESKREILVEDSDLED